MYVDSIGSVSAINSAWKRLSDSLSRVSTMDRIPQSRFDPAGLAISERMKAQYIESNMRQNNIAMEMNRDATAEAALGSIQENVHRIHELSVQASNGTLTSQDREIIQEEINSLRGNIDEIAGGTEFNSKQVIPGYTSENLGLAGVNVIGDAGGAITASKDAIDLLSSGRASLGASMNAAEKLSSNLMNSSLQTANAYNTIRGLDVAKEITEMTSAKMQLGAAMSVLKTQNEMTGQILDLFA